MYRAILLLLVLSGCATLTETQCRAPAEGWESLGEYDSIQGDQPWIEAYAEYCHRYNVEVDQPGYLKGWDTGHAEFNRRVNQTN